jgi:hypothetical protein
MSKRRMCSIQCSELMTNADTHSIRKLLQEAISTLEIWKVKLP